MSHIASDDARSFAREMWRVLEPLHAIVYFEPSAKATYSSVGLRGYWMGYFASRAACLGPASPEVVIASFYNFHPRMVKRAIPDAWRFSTPEDVLRARLKVADTAWRRLIEDHAAPVDRAATAILSVMQDVGVEGRLLFAGHRSLPVPEEPHLRLWHAATLYREYRGDGHVATLLAHGLNGLDAHLLAVATGAASRESVQPNRGWSDDEWDAGTASMVERGLLTAEGGSTPEGTSLRDRIERSTDDLSTAPWVSITDTERAALMDLLRPRAEQVLNGAGIPFPNAMAFTRDQ